MAAAHTTKHMKDYELIIIQSQEPHGRPWRDHRVLDHVDRNSQIEIIFKLTLRRQKQT